MQCFTGRDRFLSLLLGVALLGSGVISVLAEERGLGVQKTSSEKRVALVIGNSAYESAPLQNPVNDARAMAVALRKCGFEVIEKSDCNRKQMYEAIRQFGNRIRGGGTGLFYYAGHGIQVQGRNYLIPIGADVTSEEEVEFESLDVALVLRKMERAGNRVNIVILDACRNNPFSLGSRSIQLGLAKMDAPKGTYVAYATAPGSVAADGSEANGLYTSRLLEHMTTPGLRIEQVFMEVRRDVTKATGDEQVPWESTSLTGAFYFVPPQETEQPEATPTPEAPATQTPQATPTPVATVTQTPQAQPTPKATQTPRATPAPSATVAKRTPRVTQPDHEAAMGTLKVFCSAGDCSVSVDGKVIGTTRKGQYLSLEVPAGELSVVVSKEGHAEFTRKILLMPDASEKILAELEPGEAQGAHPGESQDAYLVVRSNVRDDRVFIDERDLGPSGRERHVLDPGHHHVMIEKDGYEVWEQEVTLEPGELLTLRAVLMRPEEAEPPRGPEGGPEPGQADPGPPELEGRPEPGQVDVVMLREGVPLELVWIPGGAFWMGCSRGDEECPENERPRHRVRVDGFWLGRFEVTQAQWEAVIRENPSRYPNPDLPVEQVSWENVQHFLGWAGHDLRLPTEAEWEFAARGGEPGKHPEDLNRIAWYGNNSGRELLDAQAILEEHGEEGYGEILEAEFRARPHPVGERTPTAYGLHDMFGNVWEWCQDVYREETYRDRMREGRRREIIENPLVEGEPWSPRVMRGGSWKDTAGALRVSTRVGFGHGDGAPFLGFRVARFGGR